MLVNRFKFFGKISQICTKKPNYSKKKIVCKYQSKICQKKMMLPFDNPIIDMLKIPPLGCLYRLQRVELKAKNMGSSEELLRKC